MEPCPPEPVNAIPIAYSRPASSSTVFPRTLERPLPPLLWCGCAVMTDSPFDLDELPYLVGRAWILGDGIGAEDILAPEHVGTDLASAAFVLQRVMPRPSLQPGDFIVAGLDFGHGAARKTTARGLRLIGAGAVIARSFGDAFLQSALHVGLPPLQVEETAAIKAGDRLRVDIEGHKVVNLSSGDRYVIRNIYGDALDLLRAGGMAEYLAAVRTKT
jgi:3-isopropylmalate/(R)-2-methylmalate dehydratase small subunit